MKDHVMKELRKRSTVKKKQSTWVSKLSDEQLWELYLRLRNEETAKSIARHALDVWGVEGSSIHSVSQGVLKFKKRISHLLLSPPPDDEIGSLGAVDPNASLEVLENIAKLHRARIQKMMMEENDTSVRYPHLNRDIQALASLEKVLMKRKEWESLNDDPVEVKRSRVKKRKIDAIFNSLMKGVKGDGTSIISATERLIDLAGKKSLTLEIAEDGSISLNGNKEPTDETRNTGTAA